MRDFKAEIVWRDIESITPYGHNAKLHPPEQIRKLADIIAEFGFDQPIVIDDEDVIIKGHGRLMAAQLLGMERVPTIMRDDLNDDEIRAARLADNKISETGYDVEKLKFEMAHLKEIDFDLTLTGFDFATLDTIGDLPKFDSASMPDDPNKPEKKYDGSKELNESDFQEFDNKCPKCGFEYDHQS